MRILFDHHNPFLLAHGGFQIQIEETKRALEDAGVEVEFLRWWDESQRGDLIHFFGPPPSADADLARRKGMKYVVTHLLGGLGVRSAWKRFLQKMIIDAGLRQLPHNILTRVGWSGWKSADAYIAVTSWEERLMTEVFRVPRQKVHVVPNGVSDLFFGQPTGPRNDWLVTTASIFPVKRLIETAEAAIIAQTPYWVVGQPLSESEGYYQRFVQLCHDHPQLLRFDNAMLSHAKLADLYRHARGFVLLSRWESQSLSALEAAACQCPLLLSDLAWAHSTFGESASYAPLASAERMATHLRHFYDAAPGLPRPSKPLRWSEVSEILKRIYEAVLNEARR